MQNFTICDRKKQNQVLKVIIEMWNQKRTNAEAKKYFADDDIVMDTGDEELRVYTFDDIEKIIQAISTEKSKYVEQCFFKLFEDWSSPKHRIHQNSIFSTIITRSD